jgi:hypothetical protein
MPAAVLVDAAPGVEALRNDVLDMAPGVTPAHDDPAALVEPQLRPVEVASVPAHHLVAELDTALEKQVRRDRRSPGAVWSGFHGTPATITNGIEAIKA